MRDYPEVSDLEGRAVIIVGGGARAAQKLRQMSRTPARLVVITPFAGEELSREIDASGACLISREFDADDLHASALAFACGLDQVRESTVVEAAKEREIPVNVDTMLPNSLGALVKAGRSLHEKVARPIRISADERIAS